MSGLKVLIAEDEAITRSLLRSTLTNWGYDVATTTNGEEACAKLRSGNIDLCVLDWEMPKMTGLDVCKWVRSSDLTPAPYLILLTAKNDPGDIRAGYQAGADDYVTKPFNAVELRKRMSIVAERRLQAATEQKQASHCDSFELYRAGFTAKSNPSHK
jgi:sigma-B regulation protein RsbU (phosphoserine phosphatase)